MARRSRPAHLTLVLVLGAAGLAGAVAMRQALARGRRRWTSTGRTGSYDTWPPVPAAPTRVLSDNGSEPD